MTWSPVPAETALPKPANKVETIRDIGTAFDGAAGAMSETQVVGQGAAVEGWVGTAGTANAGAAQALQSEVQSAVSAQVAIKPVLNNYADELSTAIGRIEAAQEQWDAAITARTAAINELTAPGTNRIRGDEVDPDSINPLIESANAQCAENQATARANYDSALAELNLVAQSTTTAISAWADRFVPKGRVIGADGESVDWDRLSLACFGTEDNVLGAEANWTYANSEAMQAADFFQEGDITEAELQEFIEEYGDDFDNPFFANALAARVSPDQMIGMLQQVDSSWDGASEFNAGIGTLIVLATGGVDTSSKELGAWQAGSDGLRINGNTLVYQQLQFAEQLKGVGNAVYMDGNRYSSMSAAEADQGLLPWTKHDPSYGYQWIGSAFAAAGQNESLVIGDVFLNGLSDSDISAADDLLKWDNRSLETDKHGLDPGGFLEKAQSGDSVYALLNLMDEPTNSAVDSTTLAEINDSRINSNRRFLAGDSLIAIDDGDGSRRPLGTTEYLVGHRSVPGDTFNDYGNQGIPINTYATPYEYPDQGDLLGNVIYESTRDLDDPDSYAIIHHYLQGYCDGLAADYQPAGWIGDAAGQDTFGYANRGLRAHGGEILAPYMDDISRELNDPNGRDRGEIVLESDDGYKLQLTPELRNQLIAMGNTDSPGLFADLSFDTDTSNGRMPSLATLAEANDMFCQRDLTAAMNGWPGSAGVHNVLAQYTTGFVVIERAEYADDIQLARSSDSVNNAIKGLILDGAGYFSFSKVGPGMDVLDIPSNGGPQELIDSLLPESNSEYIVAEVRDNSDSLTTSLMEDRYLNCYADYLNTQPDLLEQAAASPASHHFMEDGRIKDYTDMSASEQQYFSAWAAQMPLPDVVGNSSSAANIIDNEATTAKSNIDSASNRR